MGYRLHIIGIMLIAALSMNARTFFKGEELFINAKQNDGIGDWTKGNANLYLYLFNDQKNEWISLVREDGNIFKAVFPNVCSYKGAIVVRGSAPNWSSKWDQTPDMEIIEGWNCIDNFNDAMHRWKMYTPEASKMNMYKNGVEEELIQVCPAALETQFSLKAKLNSDKTKYLYEDINGHGWFVCEDGTTWSSVDNYAGRVRDGEMNQDTFSILPATLSAGGVYYFLYSTNPSGRRLIHIIADAPKCELDCEITSFETAISAVNADNNTFTLDGMVAFGEAEGKQLFIECADQSITIDQPKSPQSFSLSGIEAARTNGITYTAKASFIGGGEECSKTITIQVPNSTQTERIHTISAHIGEAITLVPDNTDPNNEYVWLVNGDTIHEAPQHLVLDTFRTDTTIIYMYKEFYPPVGSMDDLMDNGSYEDSQPTTYGVFGYQSIISDYIFWGVHTSSSPIHFYDNIPEGVNPGNLKVNGFAIVRNANHFAPSYAKVEARDGNNFALFDAATGAEGGNKRAWHASTQKNPKLQLKKGTTYVLSFWAANINNYGEMDNAARFVFRITNNITHVSKDSKVLDLSKPEFRNNIWHQHSETFFAEEDWTDITISVVNLNTKELSIGNDFALDDIQFHPISSVSRVVKSQQKFIIHVYKPVLFRDTICEGESYYQNGFSVNTPEVGEHEYINTIQDTLRLVVGDNHAMYRKWEDVLFISNKDRAYVGYQWYENDVEMEGETMQRLYRPEGLPGIYRCRMKLADGSFIYTCAYRFEDAPRSADVSQQSEQVLRRYQISPHIYIIQTQVGDRIETQKILTPYE